jgi:hypothetical protein
LAWNGITVLLVLLVVCAHAQDSQFLFDLTGNLQAQVGESPALPQIIGQPQMQVVVPDDSTSFSVVVADVSGISYQWYFGASPISGATSDSLLITNVSTDNQGFYWVSVSNTFGATASVLANLYIDSRGCGMPDSWQLQYFGNLTQNALGDYDGDGVNNLQEFLDGTNPTNAASALYQIYLQNDGGTVTALPSQPTYTNGQTVILTATGSDTAPFYAWTGDVTTRSSSISLVMTTNKFLYAHFTPMTFLWTNSSASSDWYTVANWTPNLAPGSNDSIILAAGGIITMNSNVDLTDVTFGLALNAVPYGSGEQNAPTLTGSGAITVYGTMDWESGTIMGNEQVTIAPEATLNLVNPGPLNFSGRTLENQGTVLWSGAGTLTVSGVITNDAAALFEMLNPATIQYGGGPVSRFDNAGTLILATNAVTAFLGVPFDDYGDVDFPSGTLTLNGGGILAGPISLPAGATINLEGSSFTSTSNLSLIGPGTLVMSVDSASLGGTINVSGSNIFDGGFVDFTGNYTCTNTMVISQGSASFDGTGLVSPSSLTLTGNAASLGGAQNVTVTGAMTWTGGIMYGAGSTIISQGATMTINSPTFVGINSRTLDNAGTLVWVGAGGIDLNAAVITNRPGALFDAQTAAEIEFGGGSPRFDNAGTFRKSVSTGTFKLALILFTNYGTVDIQSGILYADLGGYVSSANAVLNCAIGGPVAGTNYGQLQVSSGVTLNGTLSVNLTNNYIPATNSLFTVLTSGGVNSAFSNFTYPSNEVSMILSNTASSVNIIVTQILVPPQGVILQPQMSGSNFIFSFQTITNQSYTIQQNTNPPSANWLFVTNITGDGSLFEFVIPATNAPQDFFRVLQP